MMEPLSLHPLKVVTLNIGGGLQWKEAALVCWQWRKCIDFLCLTETGHPAEENLRSSGTLMAPCTKD